MLLNFFELYSLHWSGATISQNRRTHLMLAGSNHFRAQSCRKTKRPRHFSCCFWECFPDTWLLPSPAPCYHVFVSHGCSHPSEQDVNFLGAARCWMCLQWWTKQIRDATTGWVCAIPQCVTGWGDIRENECSGREHPLHLKWWCLADTQPHQSKTLLEITRGEMYEVLCRAWTMQLTYKWGKNLCQEIFIFHEWAGHWRAPGFYERQETQTTVLWAKRFDHREQRLCH